MERTPPAVIAPGAPLKETAAMPDWGFETRQIHAGAAPDPTTGAVRPSIRRPATRFGTPRTPQPFSGSRSWGTSTRGS